MKPGRLLFVLALALVAWPAAPARAAATDPIAHDPTLIKEGAYYYDVITGDSATRTYLPLRRSRDLVHWEFLPTGDGFVRIENQKSGRVLDAAGCGGAGANVQLWDWLGNACQQFRLELAGDVLILGIDVRGCRSPCRWDFTHTDLGYSTVTERRSGRALVLRHGELVLGGRRRRAAQWSLTPRNDDTYTLGNRAGGEYRVKVVLPGPGR